NITPNSRELAIFHLPPMFVESHLLSPVANVLDDFGDDFMGNPSHIPKAKEKNKVGASFSPVKKKRRQWLVVLPASKKMPTYHVEKASVKKTPPLRALIGS
ncbi:hypothetical protein HAX54_047247, partial [Datura stramonium]|nr:hypothetical protein [Datura stramonium]